jgi:exosortase
MLGVGYDMVEMKAVAAPLDITAATDSQNPKWPLAVTFAFFAIVWFEVVNHLRPEWSLNPQYGYGWIVPFVAIYLFWRRWLLLRPAAVAPASSALATALMVFCAVLFFPIRFLSEANPDWRLLSWAFAFVAVTLSILWIFSVGGWPWLRHFAFPILFFLVAVPWPMQIEQAVTQNLMRAVTSVNVWFLQFAGVPALQHGNVIEVGSGLIGIEEACSGVRSLQATLMISFFLGELYLFSVLRRIVLVIAGALLAFFCNIIRTAILVWAGAKNGPKAIEAWHDPAGLTILLVCLFGLWFLSLKMRDNSETRFENQPTAKQPVCWPWLLPALLTPWLLFAELGVQTWYRLHQNSFSSARWTVAWPNAEPGYQSVPIAPEAESLLRYNQGGGAAWQGGGGHKWMMYFFRWLPGRTAALFVKIHRPDICLPASGLTMERDNGIQLLTVNGVKLPVRSYRFDDHGTTLHVFYCYWDARSSYENVAAAEEEDWSARGRIRAALRGRRELGAQMLEVIVWGYGDDAAAREALRNQIAQLVRRT